MLKISFTKKELEELLDVIHFTPLQRRIIEYRLDEETRVSMADKENCSVSTIDREIKDIAIKIQKAYDSNLIVF
jgi:hypothetical protein